MPSPAESRDVSARRVRKVIVGLRLIALLVTVIVIPTLWRVMIWLPWQIDCLMAAGSALAFAYKFEREEGR